MAVADAGLDGRHGGITHDGVDQSGSPARDHHIDQTPGLDEVSDAGSVGAGQQLHRVGGKPLVAKRIAQYRHQRRVGLSRR